LPAEAPRGDRFDGAGGRTLAGTPAMRPAFGDGTGHG
jgi:hypothetical protein